MLIYHVAGVGFFGHIFLKLTCTINFSLQYLFGNITKYISRSPRYSWTLSEVEIAHEASLLVAADVIYSDGLTDAFFSTLERLMSLGSEKVLTKMLEMLEV